MKQNKIVPLQELTLLDRFLFDETMEDLEACRAMLEIALESEGAIEHPDEEKVRNSESPRLGKIHNRVCKVKASEEMGVKYMQEWEEKIYIREEGREEGRREGMEALILDNLEENKTEEEIIQKLIRRFAVSEEGARELFEKYGYENHKKE